MKLTRTEIAGRKLPTLPGKWPEQRRTRDPVPEHLVRQFLRKASR